MKTRRASSSQKRGSSFNICHPEPIEGWNSFVIKAMGFRAQPYTNRGGGVGIGFYYTSYHVALFLCGENSFNS